MKQVVLIGCGRIGKMHYEKLKLTSGLQVKYIIDDYVKADEYPEVMVETVTNIEKVLSDDNLDAVIIAASSSAHIELIKKAAKYKKHVFCEKPVSFDIKELNEVKQEVEQAGVKLQVGLNRRFDPDFIALKNSLEDKVIGDIQIIKITNRDPKRPDLKFVSKSGGLFFDFNTHDFDMVHYLTGDKIVEVYAMADALVEPQLKGLGDIDTALITLKLKSGTLVMIDSSRETNFGYDQRIEVFGAKGMLKVDNISETQMLCVSDKTLTQTQLPYWSFVERYENAYLGEFAAFVAYLNDANKRSPVGIDEMMESVKVASAVQSAYDKNQCVII